LEALPDFERFFAAIEAMGVQEYVRYAPHIIRGLDYYTGVVFEAHDLQGGRAVLGGGHYDNLVSAVGGDPLPGIGFAMGDVMSTIVLEKYGCIPSELTLQADQVLGDRF
jgi:histidyl-tRNA synthetase